MARPVCSIDELKEALRELGRRIPEDKLLEYSGELATCEQVGPSTESAFLVCLLHEWEKSREKTVVSKFYPEREPVFPVTQLFGIMSIDWPGMSDSCVAVFHEKEWNISFIKGMVIPHRGEMLGVVLVGVTVESPARYDELRRESRSIKQSLKKVAAGDRAKAWLVARESERYETYMNTIERIKSIYKGQNLEDLIGESGEAVKFFASRPVAYIRERRTADLARQIIGNYAMLRRVRDSGGQGQVKLANIRTRERELTGISVVGYEQDFTLDDCLRAIDHVVPSFQIRFNKEFRTEEGIVVYRMEIVDRYGQSIKGRQLKKTEAALRELTRGRRFERMRWIEKLGGVEGYARALIPYLAREQKSSGMTQVYMTLGQTIELFAEFKVLIVSAIQEPGLEQKGQRLLDRLDSAEGLSLLSYKTSTGPQNTLVQVVDVRADLALLEGPDNALARIKEIMGRAIGDFRDFDRGGRTEERGKIERLLAKLKGLDYLTVREVYFHLDDFYRLGADIDELAENIKMVVTAVSRFKKAGKRKPLVHGKNILSRKGRGKGAVLATVLAVVDRADGTPIRRWLEQLEGYDVTLSKIQKENAAILHFRVLDGGKPLSSSRLEKAVADFRRVAEGG